MLKAHCIRYPQHNSVKKTQSSLAFEQMSWQFDINFYICVHMCKYINKMKMLFGIDVIAITLVKKNHLKSDNSL